MIRLLGWLIRFCLSAVLVVVGILFLGPYLLKVVDKWSGRAEEYPSIAEQFEALGQVRDLVEAKGMGEIQFEELLRIVKSETLSAEDAQALRLNVEGLGLSPADVETLGGIYRDSLGDQSVAPADVSEPVPARESGIRPSQGLVPVVGL
jgi:ubiquinone biosynthesis protein Coq4